MDKKAAFLSVTVITLLGLYLTHTIYTNTIAVHQKNVPTQAPKRVNLTPIKSDLREIIRNATAVEKERTHKEKCSVEFKCQNGSNPAFEPSLKSVSFDDLAQLFPDVKLGGSWSPDNCDSGQKVAIVIPYRDREEHLKLFLANLYPFLKQQKKTFTIFVIEQAGGALFNRASLMNIGFLEAQKLGNFTCFIFHDVDMLPIRLCNLYECKDREATHLGVSRNTEPPRYIYRDFLGGVLALDKKAILQINGFSNIMFGWGGEDDEIFMRLKKEKIKTTHRTPAVGNYMMPKHKRDTTNPSSSRSFKQVYDNANYRRFDGLSSLNYTLKEQIQEPLYTKVVVNLTGPMVKKELAGFYANEVKKLKQKMSSGG